MAASGAPNRPPGSPWQERFLVHTGLMVGSARLSEGDGLRHSGLKPELPSVPDPKYYLEPPPSQQPALPVSKEELDRLFREEMIQSWVFRGGLTWQVAALNRWIELTPDIHMSGGHLQTDVGAFTEAARNSLWEKHRIQVDESKWFPFFRKERWFDWTQTSPPSQTTGRVWSVDDPKIWSQVSIALELADRFLKALLDVQQVDGPWSIAQLGTMMWGLIDDWTKVLPDEPEPYEGARVLLSHTKEAALAAKDGKPIPVDVPASKDKTEWQERLEWLLSTNIWCFQDSGGRSEGETMSVIMHPHASITLVDIARVTALVDGDITLAERCRMLWKLADTMVHELCHAIIVSRWQNYIPGQVNVNRKTIGALAEVLINCEGIAESGLNMENCWFGGHSNHNPHGRIPLVTILFEVPNIETCSSYYNAPGAWNADGAPIRIAGSQASYMSRLLSEAWWQNPDLPKRALDYFHRPFVFTNEATYRPGFPKHWPEWTIHPPDPSGRSNPYSDANQRDVDAFNERIRLWQHIRAGWYQTEKTLWQNTPWCYSTEIFSIAQFSKAFAEKNRVHCNYIAEGFLGYINWTDRAQFFAGLPQDEFDLPSTGWMFHCIGLLMMASLPWRRAAEVKEKEEDVWVMYMDPSQEAAAAGHQRLFMPKIRGTAQRLSHSENQFFDQINNRGLVNNFSQFDYLQAALDMLKLVASTTLVHLPWAEAILDAYRSLRGDRQSLYEHYTLGARRLWASQWFFKVPQYRNYVGRVENGVPREMRRNASTDKWEYVP